jgi:hypothetical protein
MSGVCNSARLAFSQKRHGKEKCRSRDTKNRKKTKIEEYIISRYRIN